MWKYTHSRTILNNNKGKNDEAGDLKTFEKSRFQQNIWWSSRCLEEKRFSTCPSSPSQG